MGSSPVRLLIAEDEDDIRASMENHIRTNAKSITEIYTAENGSQAIDIILRYRPQMMLLDIQMPLKDGITVMQEACAAGVCPRTIILSGHDQFSYAQQALRYGAVDYLLKPCRAAELLSKLDRLAREVSENGSSVSQSSEDRQQVSSIVAKALEYMERHYHENLTLSSVAEVISITPNYLSALFRKTINAGFTDKLNQIRIERACDYFAAGSMRTYEVAYKVGFKDEKYFSVVFKKLKKESPSEYKKRKERGIPTP